MVILHISKPLESTGEGNHQKDSVILNINVLWRPKAPQKWKPYRSYQPVSMYLEIVWPFSAHYSPPTISKDFKTSTDEEQVTGPQFAASQLPHGSSTRAEPQVEYLQYWNHLRNNKTANKFRETLEDQHTPIPNSKKIWKTNNINCLFQNELSPYTELIVAWNHICFESTYNTLLKKPQTF